ncbi:MAG: CO dehydrogenase/acetyl-CoA synthase subunit delta [Methanomicrobiales archaeon]|nr:CO dehydrogenase/acetyl-CoA synthase subunit delta [Methanomicrobiales archaeon]
MGPRLLSLLSGQERVELERFEMEIGELELWFPGGGISPATAPSPLEDRPAPSSLFQESFSPPTEKFPGQVREIVLGARSSEGGSRGSTVMIGGASSPAYWYEYASPRLPVIALDVFDMNVALPRPLKENIADVMADPAAWAKRNVEKFGAEVVTIHLMSTDPLIHDTSPSDAARTVEEVLQAVDVPLIIGGCGDPRKDAQVFTRVAEVASGERVLLNSVTLDMAQARTLETVANAAKEHGHLLLAFTGLDLNSAKELNRRLYAYIPPEQVAMDLTTAALGYGLEYSFTIHERARMAALMGDGELQHPTVSGSTNAWAAREAWMALDPVFGPREVRGPLWETITALSLLLAGLDLLMMMHPAAVQTVREVTRHLMTTGKAGKDRGLEWVRLEI